MPTENINIETQVQVDITRAALQALIAANTVKKKIYHITDAIGGANKIAVFSLTTSTTSFNALNFTNGKFGKYYIGPDLFVAIVEGMGGVLPYNSFAVFPTTGLQNTVYIDLATNELYYWNGSSYELLSGGNVYEPTVDDFPTIGSVDTLYVATGTGVMYLWDTTDEVYVALSDNGNYIPLAGTNTGEPVTGDIEVATDIFWKLFQNDSGTYYTKEFGFDDSTNAFVRVTENTTGIYSECIVSSDGTTLSYYDGLDAVQFSVYAAGILASSSVSSFEGIRYNTDYSANFTLRSLIDQEVMKSRIWTKAGTPTATDDVNAGYLVGSLIWDTTNSILYKCTDNTAGAATWDLAIPKPTMYYTIRVGSTVPSPAGTIRYACVGFAGLSTTAVAAISPNVVHGDFKVYLGTAQPATGSLEIRRIFVNTSGTVLQTDTLTIAAGSAAAFYTFNSATFDATAVDCTMRFEIQNNATSQSGIVASMENQYS